MATMLVSGNEELVDYEEEDQSTTAGTVTAVDASREKESRGNYTGIHSANWRDLLLRTELTRALTDVGFEHPSEVQNQAIPQAVLGLDILCQAKSGMGKTAVFVLAVLHQLADKGKLEDVVHCIGITHTRELAFQVKNEFDRFGKYLVGIRSGVMFGGVSIAKHKEMLSKPETTPHILLGTPGRLVALIRDNVLKLNKVAHFVIDECDQCLEKLDMRQDVQTIFKATSLQKQVMMFSATLSREVRATCRKFMQNPLEIAIDDETKLTLHGLTQYYVKLNEELKNRKLNEVLDKLEFNQVIIFVSNIARASALGRLLVECKFPCVVIHSKMNQDERISKYQNFKNFNKRIMVATDLFGRGIDVERVNVVINYDMPDSTDTYLHRVGRAGRFGTRGLAITFVASEEDSERLNQVQARFEVNIAQMPDQISPHLYINH